MSVKTGVSVKNMERLLRSLAKIPQKAQGKALRNAVAKSMTPVSKKARSEAPVDSGALKRSIGKKSKSYQRGLIAVSMVGPRKRIANVMSGNRLRIPRHYVHLVERGRKAGTNKRGGRSGAMKANDFIQRSYRASKREVADRLETFLRQNIRKAWKGTGR